MPGPPRTPRALPPPDPDACAACPASEARAIAERSRVVCNCGAEFAWIDARDRGRVVATPRPEHRNARREVRAMLTCPEFGLVSSARERDAGGRPDDGLTPHERFLETYGWMLKVRDRARARLEAMVARGGDGPRFARLLEWYYREEGNSRDMHGTLLARLGDAWGTKGERGAWLTYLGRADPKRRRRIGAVDEAIAFGGELLDAATDAYDRDEWRAVVPETLPEELRTARERFLDRMAAAFARAKAHLLAPATETPDADE